MGSESVPVGSYTRKARINGWLVPAGMDAVQTVDEPEVAHESQTAPESPTSWATTPCMSSMAETISG